MEVENRMEQESGTSCSLAPVLGYTAQIIASIIVLSKSRDEKPHAPLATWIIGYTVACAVSLLLLIFCRFRGSTVSDYEEMDVRLISFRANQRLEIFMGRLKLLVDIFFLVWFILGNVWVFGGHSSVKEAPNLYWLCIAFLVFNYVVYFFLCVTLCCCLPCLVALVGFNIGWGKAEDANRQAEINALPTCKFKVKHSVKVKGTKKGEDSEHEGSSEGGFVSFGTNMERAVSADDAMCCICLGKYKNGVDLKELPCAHFFHTKCIDAWLKISTYCPLCKGET